MERKLTANTSLSAKNVLWHMLKIWTTRLHFLPLDENEAKISRILGARVCPEFHNVLSPFLRHPITEKPSWPWKSAQKYTSSSTLRKMNFYCSLFFLYLANVLSDNAQWEQRYCSQPPGGNKDVLALLLRGWNVVNLLMLLPDVRPSMMSRAI